MANIRKIWIVRHGSTDLNDKGKSRGWGDIPLSDKGQEEVKKTANKIKDKGIEIIVSSDLKRAMQTAKAIKGATNAKLLETGALRTWDSGDLAGKDQSSTNPTFVEYATKKPNKPLPNGESFNQYKKRFFTGLQQALDISRGKELAIVNHHWGERMIQAWIAKGQPADKSVDLKVFFAKGEPPASAQQVDINETNAGAKTNKAVKNILKDGMAGM